MPSITLRHGTIDYRVAGPPDAPRPVVFVHGFLVDGGLWTGVADALAAAGVRSYAPTWPLGSHRQAMDEGAEQSPAGMARLVNEFLERLGLDDVTLVGNDTGGAVVQFLLDADHSRVGRVVLTNCDAFEEFPPGRFKMMFKIARRPGRIKALIGPTRFRPIRHSPIGFGPLVAGKLDADLTRRWIEPCRTDRAIRVDTARFLREVDPDDLLAVSNRLSRFRKPVLLVWGAADKFFRLDFAHRLAGVLPDATVVEVAGAKTFVPLDEPQRVAGEIVAAFYAPDGAGADGRSPAGQRAASRDVSRSTGSIEA